MTLPPSDSLLLASGQHLPFWEEAKASQGQAAILFSLLRFLWGGVAVIPAHTGQETELRHFRIAA